MFTQDDAARMQRLRWPQDRFEDLGLSMEGDAFVHILSIRNSYIHGSSHTRVQYLINASWQGFKVRYCFL